MAKDKKKYIEESYIKRLKEGRESYEERKEYIKTFTTKKSKKTDGESGNGGSTGEGVADVQLNGNMPTIDQYKGPDAYYDELIGENYQAGLKNKLKGTDKWNDEIIKQAGKAGANPLMAKVLMAIESGGHHSSTPNDYNCVGLMQVQGSTATGLKLDWGKVRNDPAYNIYAGCLVMKSKHEYAKGIIKRNKSPYTTFKARGAELIANVQGVAWLYNGFSMPSNGSSKVTSGGYVYGRQAAEMYKGFGRDPIKDTVHTLDVLENSNSSSSGSSGEKTENKAKSIFSATRDISISALKAQAVISEQTDFFPVRAPLSEDEKAFLQSLSGAYSVPIGKLTLRSFSPPKYLRANYVNDRKSTSAYLDKFSYTHLDPNEFIHLGQPFENYYSIEAANLFKLLKAKLGKPKLIVTRGFDPQGDQNDSSHSIGIAMDIYVDSPEEAIRIADAAWILGIRSIAIGPKFVHVDAGPPANWSYGTLPMYDGPGSVKVGGLRDGY